MALDQAKQARDASVTYRANQCAADAREAATRRLRIAGEIEGTLARFSELKIEFDQADEQCQVFATGCLNCLMPAERVHRLPISARSQPRLYGAVLEALRTHAGDEHAISALQIAANLMNGVLARELKAADRELA